MRPSLLVLCLCLSCTLAAALSTTEGDSCSAELEVSLLQTGLWVDRRDVEASQHHLSVSTSHSQHAHASKHEIVAATDVELELQDVLADVCDADRFNFTGMTNPSFLKLPDSDTVLSVFRGLCLGGPTDLTFGQWTSHIVMGSTSIGELHSGKATLNWTSYDRLSSPALMGLETLRNGTELKECLDPFRAIAALSEGPEDPKLFTTNGKMYLMYVGESIVPAATPDLTWGAANIFTGRPPCGAYNFHPHVVELVALPPHAKFGPVVPLVLPGMRIDEKNWGTFNYRRNSSEREELLMVYDMSPHTILKVDFATGHVERLYNESSSVLHSLAQDLGADSTDFHCSGAHAVPVECSNGSPCNLAITHQHIDDAQGNRTYKHWAYKFAAEPPFEIREVGKQLMLKSLPNPAVPIWHVQFVTSLLVDAEHIIIGYNTGDQHANIFRMPYAEFESEFFPVV
jgi:hypothetical protein